MGVSRGKSFVKAEFGDFQTPPALAQDVCRLLADLRVSPASVVEPTCGRGSLLFAALDRFPAVRKAIALDINAVYAKTVSSDLAKCWDELDVAVIEADFFRTDWAEMASGLPEPILVVGNPPWVTNAALSTLGSSNFPEKSNFQTYRGFDAITGKSNFDISEWMLIDILGWLNGRDSVMAMLCKTAVARKVLTHAWKHRVGLGDCRIFQIDAWKQFGAAVDACLLYCELSPSSHTRQCRVHGTLDMNSQEGEFGYHDDRLVADISLYRRWKHLIGPGDRPWRSGIKHDCAKVMELRRAGQRFQNALGEVVDLEDECLFPLLKGSDLANGNTSEPRFWMLVTQRQVGDETLWIKHKAPRTWQYLNDHVQFLDCRASSIYKGRPRFSVFGVGQYSFAPWKVAIAALYKRLDFRIIGSLDGKPVVLDDTVCFLACKDEEEADYLSGLLNSAIAKEFFNAFIFWDSKRPITVGLLNQLSLRSLARELGEEHVFERYLLREGVPQDPGRSETPVQMNLL